MRFRAEQIKQIRSGRRTMLRIPAIAGKDCPFKPGRAPLVKRTADSELRITITDVRQERLGDISLRDVKAEGWHTTAEFREDWIERYGEHDADQMVWVVGFIKGDYSDAPRIPAARPGPPHGDYTSAPSRGLTGCGDEVEPRLLEKYASEAQVAYSGTLAERKQRLQVALAEIRRHAKGPAVNAKLREAERRIKNPAAGWAMINGVRADHSGEIAGTAAPDADRQR